MLLQLCRANASARQLKKQAEQTRASLLLATDACDQFIETVQALQAAQTVAGNNILAALQQCSSAAEAPYRQTHEAIAAALKFCSLDVPVSLHIPPSPQVWSPNLLHAPVFSNCSFSSCYSKSDIVHVLPHRPASLLVTAALNQQLMTTTLQSSRA